MCQDFAAIRYALVGAISDWSSGPWAEAGEHRKTDCNIDSVEPLIRVFSSSHLKIPKVDIMDHSHMDHGHMGHGGMDHGGMDHGDMCNMNVRPYCTPEDPIKTSEKLIAKTTCRCCLPGTPTTCASSSSPGASPPQCHLSGLWSASCC